MPCEKVPTRGPPDIGEPDPVDRRGEARVDLARGRPARRAV